MKTLPYLIALALLAFSCKKEKNCPEGDQGENCDQEIEPGIVGVSEINLVSWPLKKPNGQNWDAGSGAEANPDIYMVIGQATTQDAFSPTKPNYSGGSIVWTTDFRMRPDDGVYLLFVYDDDGLESELIGVVNMPLWIDGEGFPSSQFYEYDGTAANFSVYYKFY